MKTSWLALLLELNVAFMHAVNGVRLDQALDLETSSEL